MGAVPWLIHSTHVLYNLNDTEEAVYRQNPLCLNTSCELTKIVRTDVICRRLRGVPIMILFLHARMANMARALEQRTIWPVGRSCMR